MDINIIGGETTIAPNVDKVEQNFYFTIKIETVSDLLQTSDNAEASNIPCPEEIKCVEELLKRWSFLSIIKTVLLIVYKKKIKISTIL